MKVKEARQTESVPAYETMNPHSPGLPENEWQSFLFCKYIDLARFTPRVCADQDGLKCIKELLLISHAMLCLNDSLVVSKFPVGAYHKGKNSWQSRKSSVGRRSTPSG